MSKLNLPGMVNASQDVVPAEVEATVIATHDDQPEADLLLMMDIESWALGPRPVITQIAMLGYELEQDELLQDRYFEYLPVEPQLSIIPPRKIQASTIAWWMRQTDEAREGVELNTGEDFEDLVAAGRGLILAFNRLTKNGSRNYELCAKGPQFDIVAIETLLKELGLEVPWSYDRVTDLRTDMRRAKVNGKKVPQPTGCVPHNAYWDARWQIEMYLECRRVRIGGRA